MARFHSSALAGVIALGAVLWARSQPAQETQGLMDFQPPSVASVVEPRYPPASIAQGTVTLELTVNEDGGVESIRPLVGIPSLTEAAVTSVRQWKFKPALLNGRPTRATFAASFTFVPPVITPGGVPGRP